MTILDYWKIALPLKIVLIVVVANAERPIGTLSAMLLGAWLVVWLWWLIYWLTHRRKRSTA